MPSHHKPKATKEQRSAKRKNADDALKELQQQVDDFDLTKEINAFADLPLSPETQSGLEDAKFTTLTDIQKRAIPVILKGKDVLGAARTGSGKTLAFLIPMLELLYRENWSQLDGLGALIVSPTRELSIQIFDVLKKIGKAHGLSAGLVVGGKDVKDEATRMLKMNIVVCTPGRLLQHMDQTAGFSADNLKMLILDEADRILNLGFRKTLDAIVDNLPPSRQTLLFSATQTKSVKDLARLSLKDPEYIAVHESAASATPAQLQQNYILTTLPEKLDTLWGFIKTHLKCKAIVFMTTSKQVRFAYETFRHLQPGVPLIHLHGRQSQSARLETTTRFRDSQFCFLFCTDVVARGLDFPSVDWVVQLDCPEDADTYIHRVGRTARYEKGGKALLMLMPSEEGAFLARLKKKKVELERLNVKLKKKLTVSSQLQHMCFQYPETKHLGQKAFISYIRSVTMRHDTDVFKAHQLPIEEYAKSLGLPGAPRIKILSAEEIQKRKNARKKPASDSESDLSGEDVKKSSKTKVTRMFDRTNHNILSEDYTKLIHDPASDESEADDDFINLKRADHALQDDTALPGFKADSKRKQKEALSRKAMLKYKPKGQKLVFDEDGTTHDPNEMKETHDTGTPDIASFIELQKQEMSKIDAFDKDDARARKRELKRIKLEKERAGLDLPPKHTPTSVSVVSAAEPPTTLQDQEALALQLLA